MWNNCALRNAVFISSLPDGFRLPGLEVEMERQRVEGKEMPQIPHESEISSYKLCTTITSFTTVCEPGIESEVVYSRKMCFSVWWGWGAGLCIYPCIFFFLWTVHSQLPFLRAVHGACGVRRYKAAFF